MSGRQLNAAERQREIEMLSTPLRWPYWPNLPVKHPEGRTGFVTADYPMVVLKGRPTMSGILIQLAYEDELPNATGGPATRRDDLTDDHRKAYEGAIIARFTDLDGLLDAGWRVD